MRFRLRLTQAAGLVVVGLCATPAFAQSFRVQCPYSTITHPDPGASTGTDNGVNSIEPNYVAPTTLVANAQGYLVPSAAVKKNGTNSANVNGAIKCQQVSGGDGYATMADGTQTYMFSFGPLSGIHAIANGAAGTQYPDAFNGVYSGTFLPGDPATSDGAADGPGYTQGNPAKFTFDGAVGQIPDAQCAADPTSCATNTPKTPTTGVYAYIDGHVDPRQIMDVGVMNGNIPAPLMAIDEDDEFFLTLTNVGMIMRPDLFEQHTIHFHGYPNASSVYDGVPDASVAITIGGSFTYYYLAPDAGTYFWHCHITPPEHLQMGMVGQLYVRPRQDRVPAGTSLLTALKLQNGQDPRQVAKSIPTDLRTACNPNDDILCSTVSPSADSGAKQGAKRTDTKGTSLTYAQYVYNDGDGSTAYDTEFPMQIHGFDPNFHFVGMTFNPEGFVDMKDKYFLMNGRSYPDTVSPGPQATQSSDGRMHYSQPLPSIISIPAGGKALLRLSDLSVTEYATIASLGVPMHVVGYNAKLLRDQEGNNTDYYTNSITIGGGESADVILDASDAGCGSAGCAAQLYPKGSVFYVYTPNLDHLSNDAENFGGLMTEVHII